MIFYPAIDIKDGKCVRLLRGNMNEETIFNNSPENQAETFEKLGCEWIHIVDLNGAIDGIPVNRNSVQKIISKVKIPIQLGGGIRTMQTIEYWLEQGLNRIILGTAAIENLQLVKLATKEFPGKIAVGIDAKNGYVSTNGWTYTSSIESLELAKQLEGFGVSHIIYTDIEKDGTLNGPNIEQTERLANSINIPVIASGGISSLTDLRNLKKSTVPLNGVISGRAIYDKIFNVGEAIEVLRS